MFGFCKQTKRETREEEAKKKSTRQENKAKFVHNYAAAAESVRIVFSLENSQIKIARAE